jgi:hypothetical protein
VLPPPCARIIGFFEPPSIPAGARPLSPLGVTLRRFPRASSIRRTTVVRLRDTSAPRLRVLARPRTGDAKRDVLRRLLIPLVLGLVLVLGLAFAPSASAGGGTYAFDGGTRAEQAQVRAALNASSFDWGVVPGRTVIHIGRGDGPHATAGQIWLDASLLDSGRFSWGVVQHEYAHQVDFGVLTDGMRAQLHALLGGSSWWGGAHASLDCERFADALAWAYWPSPDNVLRPDASSAVSGQAGLSRFKSQLSALLQPVRSPAAVQGTRHPRNG